MRNLSSGEASNFSLDAGSDNPVEAFYGRVASEYDRRYATDYCVREEVAILSFIRPLRGAVLDVGCGTGLLARHESLDDYVGIDPSDAMLDVFRREHPEYSGSLVHSTLENYQTDRTFDTIVSLFTAMNYVAPQDRGKVRQLLAPGGSAYLVYAERGYYPDLHGGVVLPWYPSPASEPYARINRYEIHVMTA